MVNLDTIIAEAMGVEYFGDIQVNDFTKMINNLAEQYGKED